MFYERLKAICDMKGTTITAVVKAVSGSTGSVDGWKKGRAPSSDIVVRMAKYLDVSSDYLLGLSEVMIPNSSDINLAQSETTLITNLRNADPVIRDAVLRMASAVLLPQRKEENVFLSPNDRKTHHAVKKDGDVKFLKHVEGDAAAGVPITAVPEDDLSILVPEKYLDSRYFIVRARGESMADHIPNGAYCVFQRDAHVDDGSIVLVQIDSKTDQPDDTIKRIYRMGKDIELRSDNPAFAPMRYPTKSVRVTGVFVDVLPRSENV